MYARDIEHPERYAAARTARIRQNANTTRRRALVAAIASDAPAFRAWLGLESPVTAQQPNLWALVQETAAAWNEAKAEWKAVGGEPTPEQHAIWQAWTNAMAAYEANRSEAQQRYDAAMQALVKSHGVCPQWLLQAITEWGGLTENQLAAARRIFVQQSERLAKREQEQAAMRANATAWVAGRQQVSGTVLTRKVQETDYGTSIKLMLQTDTGARLLVSEPSAIQANRGDRVTLTCTVQPSDDDATFAFGSRPTKPLLIPVEG